MTSNQLDERLKSKNRLLSVRNRLAALRESLEAVPLWRPSAELLAEVLNTINRVNELEESAERKMAVVIVGPTGAGKSTLLNALAGKDDRNHSQFSEIS
ncbi:MAG: GTPase RsgA [Planctomycetes bacterium]|nr:GTPase RsgA [Planctomycetota bacterium]